MMLLVGVGLAYAVAFWIICAPRPHLALMFIFASAPFQQDISGGGPLKFSLAEVNLLLSVPLLLVRGRPQFLQPLIGPILFYIGTGVISSLLSWRDTSLISLIQESLYWVVAPLVFVGLARTPKDYSLSLNCLLVIGVFLACVSLIIGSNSYLGLSKNGVGGSLACAVVVGTELYLSATKKMWKRFYMIAMGITICGLIMSLSRGAWLAAASGFLVLFGLRRQFVPLIRIGTLMIPVVLVCWSFMPKHSRNYALAIGRENYSINARYYNAEWFKTKFEENPILGVGVGLRKEHDATSVIWLTLAETGIVGLFAFLLVHLVYFSMLWGDQHGINRSTQAYSLLAIGGALVAGRFVHGLFDHYWGRGPMMIAWAAVGMSVHARGVIRKSRRLKRHVRAGTATDPTEQDATPFVLTPQR